MSLSFKSIPLKDFLESHNKDYTDSKVFGLEEFKEKVQEHLESFDKNKGQNEKANCCKCFCTLFIRVRIPHSSSFQTKRQ